MSWRRRDPRALAAQASYYANNVLHCCRSREDIVASARVIASGVADQKRRDWLSESDEVEGLSQKPTIQPVERPSSLNLDHSICWSCAVCSRLARSRSPPLIGQLSLPTSTAAASSGYSTDRDYLALKQDLPPPLDLPLDMNDENLTDVTVLSEESYFTHDEEETFLHQSGSFRHFKLDFLYALVSSCLWKKNWSFRHFDADSLNHMYEDIYSETVFSETVRTNTYGVPRQNSPESVTFLSPTLDSSYNKSRGSWPPYMPPTPPIPHIYYVPSPDRPTSYPFSISSMSNFAEKLYPEAQNHTKRVRFSDHVSIRIIFGGEGNPDLVIDTQLVEVFRFRRVVGFGPNRVVVVALHGWMSCIFGTAAIPVKARVVSVSCLFDSCGDFFRSRNSVLADTLPSNPYTRPFCPDLCIYNFVHSFDVTYWLVSCRLAPETLSN